MGRFKGGVIEAAKLLGALGGAASKSLLAEIEKKDPLMAKKLKDNLITLEDLQYLTPEMLAKLLKKIELKAFALALRTVDEKIVESILSKLSKSLRDEINEELNSGPQSLNNIEKFQQALLALMRELITKGEIFTDRTGDKN